MARKNGAKGADSRIPCAEVEIAFQEAVRASRCPACGLAYTEHAVQFADVWKEGRRDTLRELDLQERDGPYKVCCDACGKRAWFDVFAGTATLADE